MLVNRISHLLFNWMAEIKMEWHQKQTKSQLLLDFVETTDFRYFFFLWCGIDVKLVQMLKVVFLIAAIFNDD